MLFCLLFLYLVTFLPLNDAFATQALDIDSTQPSMGSNASGPAQPLLLTIDASLAPPLLLRQSGFYNWESSRYATVSPRIKFAIYDLPKLSIEPDNRSMSQMVGDLGCYASSSSGLLSSPSSSSSDSSTSSSASSTKKSVVSLPSEKGCSSSLITS